MPDLSTLTEETALSVMDEWETFMSQFARAQEIQDQLDKEVHELSVKLFTWISAKLPPGTVIDVRHRNVRSDPRPLPMYLRGVEVLVGNARGSRIFRIEQMQRVVINPHRPDRTTWIAKATPISEVTSKDMTGKAGNPKSYMGTDFQLQGKFCLQLDL